MARTKSGVITAEWNKKLENCEVSKEELDRLVMDYLCVEGYMAAADEFAKEAAIPSPDRGAIEKRISIRDSIQRGQIPEAIAELNDLDGEILDSNATLHFHLQQQQLIELIRQGKIAEALWFAQTELSPRGEENPAFLAELERTMTLLAFEIPPAGVPSPSKSESPSKTPKSKKSKDKEAEKDLVDEWSTQHLPPNLASLLRPSQRLATANEVNAAILASQGHGPNPKLPGLLRMLAWGEDLLSAKLVFPKLDMAQILNKTKYTVAADSKEVADIMAEDNFGDSSAPMELEL